MSAGAGERQPLFTIGSTRKPLRRFIALLQEAGVDAVVDVRLNNTSQLAGFSKRDDLEFLLEEGFGIRYAHHPELAPTPEILDAYHRDRDWDAYRAAFTALMAERGMAQHASEVLAEFERPCLLCAEDEPDHCHRRLVAEGVAAIRPEMEVTHLR